RALSGVHTAALGQHVPLGISSSSTDFTIPGLETGPREAAISVGSTIVGDGYFDALGIPILRGRAFSDRDTASAPPVAIVNEETAGGGGEPRAAGTVTERDPRVTAEVIGVARQSKTRDIGETPQPLLYLPIDQRPQTGMFLFVHTAGDPGAASEAVRAEVRAI